MSWIYNNSFVSAHTDLSDWEAWCEATQRALPLNEADMPIIPFPMGRWQMV
jgi:hypothetical protein